jgi:hypothetical protein
MEARKFVIGDQVRLLLDNYERTTTRPTYILSRVNFRRRPMSGSTG